MERKLLMVEWRAAWKATAKWTGIGILSLCVAFNLRSSGTNSNLNELVSAETKFAQTAAETSIRNAFLANLDSTGVVFQNGKAINGIAAYTQTPDSREELLSWYPTVAHVSSAGDLGFTSGPYQFFAERSKEPVGSGYFFSIWQKNAGGKFKLLLDGGVPSSTDHANAFKSNPKPDSAGYDFLKSNITNPKKELPWEAEKTFVNLAATHPQSAYTNYLAETSLMLRNNQHAGLSRKANLATIEMEKSDSYEFVTSRQGISQNADLAYCYGEVKLAKSSNLGRGFFVRVWQFQSDGWKIVAEEISLSPQRKLPTN